MLFLSQLSTVTPSLIISLVLFFFVFYKNGECGLTFCSSLIGGNQDEVAKPFSETQSKQ